jgi:transposase-like protein
MAAAAIRTIFAQPGPAQVAEQLDVIAGMLGRQFPRVEAMLRDAADDITAFAGFPIAHWKKIWSTNPLSAEQGNQAPHRRRRRLPQPRGPAPLAGAVLAEAHDEWQAGDRRYLSESSMAMLAARPADPKEVATPALLTA